MLAQLSSQSENLASQSENQAAAPAPGDLAPSSGGAAIVVQDLARAIAFYCGLGLRLRLLTGAGWAHVETDGLRLCLVVGAAPRPASHLVLEVPTLAGWAARLAELGARVDGPIVGDDCVRSLPFRDPFGNRLALLQVRRGPAGRPVTTSWS